MGVIEAETALIDALGRRSVRRKGNRTWDLRATARRISRSAPEVMVKITGFGKGGKHVESHLDYISRNGKVELETERGEVLSGRQEVKEFFAEWKNDFGDGGAYKARRDTMHMVLSMPETTDPEGVRNAVRQFAKKTFGANHEYVFALHTDEPHPHCHVTVKCLGRNGRRLHVGRHTAQAWREGFAEAMRDQGVDAEATPRRSRGKVKKSEKNVIRHIERGDKTHKPRVSKVKAARIKETADELLAETQGQPATPKPWEEKIKATQTAIRGAWLAAATALEQSAEGQSLSEQIKGFVDRMPAIDTARHELKASLMKQFTQQRGQEKGVVDASDQQALLQGARRPGNQPGRDAER